MDPAGALSTGLQEAAAVVLAALVAVALLALGRARARRRRARTAPAHPGRARRAGVELRAVRPRSATTPPPRPVAALIGAGLLVLAAWALRKKPVVLPALALGVPPLPDPDRVGRDDDEPARPALPRRRRRGARVHRPGAVERARRGRARHQADRTGPGRLRRPLRPCRRCTPTTSPPRSTSSSSSSPPFALLFLILLEVPWTQTTARLVPRGADRGGARARRRSGSSNTRRQHAAAQPEGHRHELVLGRLPRQLAVLRPEHLRALPRARDDRRDDRAAVDAHAAHGDRPAPSRSPSWWGGLVLTFSQSSFAALLVGLAILAALRWSPKRTAARWVALAGDPRDRHPSCSARARCTSTSRTAARSTAPRPAGVDLIQGGLGPLPAAPGRRLRGPARFARPTAREHRNSRQRAVSASHT